ncbi:hypothetical protein [Halomarina oriensis]|uniref:Uncharacterized protein n=1 Tax=Halomarina oriensis TaxID=671145 RepID=A0A6B0GQZ1_9EURY|nr:hypothetical protein [Halomarina oriensis]MWG36019.1 hypothetical protein [Halomarina oriensis]
MSDDSAEDPAGTDAEGADSGGGDDTETTLADRARDDLLQLVTSLATGSTGEALDALEDLEAVAAEAEDVASTVDAGDLPDAIDLSRLPEVVSVDDIAYAIVSGDTDDIVDTNTLLDILELGELFDAVDVREFWRNAEELEAELEDALGEEGLAEWKDRLGMGEDGDGDGDEDVEWSTLADAADDDAVQAGIQTQLRDAIDEFREGVLDARKQLVERRAELEEKTESVGQPDSRNPTAFSSMAGSRPDIGNAARGSTVPTETRYSSAPNRGRIYGDRFEKYEDADDEVNDDA